MTGADGDDDADERREPPATDAPDDPAADLPPEVVDETRDRPEPGETAEFEPSTYGYGVDGEDTAEETPPADRTSDDGKPDDDRSDGSDADGDTDDTDDIIDIGGQPTPDFVDDDWEPDAEGPVGGASETSSTAAIDDTASDGGTVAESTFAGDDDGGILSDGPEYDEEMPLADHIEEMVRRLGVVVVVMAVVSIGVLPFSDAIINYVWYTILGTAQDVPTKPNVYKPLSLLLARLKTATLAGFVVALPLFVYETYLFMRPGLYPNERRYYLAAVPTSLVLAVIGVAFAFFLVLPAIFIYFLYYSEQAAAIAFGLSDTYGLMLMLMGFFAVIFQIPLFIMLAIMMNLTSREWLAERRILFWGAFLGIALLFSPDPTGMAPIIVALTMVALFEGTLLLLRWTDRDGRRGGGPEVEP
jgi:sec-independent protein translocase protein TatC